MTKTVTQKLTLGCTLIAMTLPMSALAQGRPAGPPLDKISAELNVSEDALRACMPAPAKGQRPERPDPAGLASCLQGQNASVTAAAVTSVMEALKPPRGQRGN